MSSHAFEAIGTKWFIEIDSIHLVPLSFWELLTQKAKNFEKSFSRFIDNNEVTSFKNKPAGTYPISTQLCELLVTAKKLSHLTNGLHDPAIGLLMEATGYDKQYSFQENASVLNSWHLPQWSVDELKQSLTIDQPLVFDLGGTAKGYLIDEISSFLDENEYPHHLVDGGGDMRATAKQDGTGWRVALEYPGKPDSAIGMLEIKNQGFAASDTLRRQWKRWNHLINPTNKSSVSTVMGCYATAPTAWLADQTTAALCLSQPSQYTSISQALGSEYLVLLTNGEAHLSSEWHGDFF